MQPSPLSVRSIRKRLLELLPRPKLVELAENHHDERIGKSGKSSLISYMLDHWQPEYDAEILSVVDKAIPRKK